MKHLLKIFSVWTAAMSSLLMAMPTRAQHDYDLLFGYDNGVLAVMQPTPHPVRQMVTVSNTFLLDVGMDFFTPDRWLNPMLQRCRVVQVWISPGLVGTKSGVGAVFSTGNTPNFFDLPFAGTPHHHFIFSTSAQGVYVLDLRAINGVDYLGNPLMDMPEVYRIYMVAGNPPRFFGNVQPSPLYDGQLYGLWLKARATQNGSTVASAEQPINPWAVHTYMVGLRGSGSAQIGAKLEKHLSVRVSRSLSGAQQLHLTFPFLGDTNEDDQIDQNDLAHIADRFGSELSSADLNGDGIVNLHDLYPVLVHHGRVGEDRN